MSRGGRRFLALDVGRVRLRAVWLLVVPFLWLARPTPDSLVLGGGLATLGLALRAWAAGTIRKGSVLATSGPYAHTRNPLYAGTLLLGLGVTIAGGHWIWPTVFLAFFASVYGLTMRKESAELTRAFGERYRQYAAHVPSLLPRPTPYRAPHPTSSGDAFRFAQYLDNREWEALLGVVAGFAFLTWRCYSIG